MFISRASRFCRGVCDEPSLRELIGNGLYGLLDEFSCRGDCRPFKVHQHKRQLSYNTPRLTKGQRRRRREYKVTQANKLQALKEDKRRKHSGDYMSKMRKQGKLELQQFINDPEALVQFEKEVQDFIRIITRPMPSLDSIVQNRETGGEAITEKKHYGEGMLGKILSEANLSSLPMKQSQSLLNSVSSNPDSENDRKMVNALAQKIVFLTEESRQKKIQESVITEKTNSVSQFQDSKVASNINLVKSTNVTEDFLDVNKQEFAPDDRILVEVINTFSDMIKVPNENDEKANRISRFEKSQLKLRIIGLFDTLKVRDDWHLSTKVSLAVLGALSKAGAGIAETVNFIENELEKLGVVPDAPIVDHVLRMCIQKNEPELGWNLYNKMLSRYDFSRSLATYSSVLKLSSMSGETERAISLLDEARLCDELENFDPFAAQDSQAGIAALADHLTITQQTYHNAIGACSRSIHFSHYSDDILEMMLNDGRLAPNHHTLSLMMTACARIATVEKAEQTWGNLVTAYGVKPDTIAYNSLLNVYARNQWNSGRKHRSLYRAYDPWEVVQNESGLNNKNPTVVRTEQYYDEARAVADQLRLLPDEAFFTGIAKDHDYFAIEEDEAKGMSIEEQMKLALGLDNAFENEFEEGCDDEHSFDDIEEEPFEGHCGNENTNEGEIQYQQFVKKQKQILHTAEGELAGLSDDSDIDVDGAINGYGAYDFEDSQEEFEEDIHILDLMKEVDDVQDPDEVENYSEPIETLENLTYTESDEANNDHTNGDNLFKSLNEGEMTEVMNWENENASAWEENPVFEMPRKQIRRLSNEEKKQIAYDFLLKSKHNLSTGLMALETMDSPQTVERRNIEKAEALIREMDNKQIPLDEGTLNNLLRVYSLAFRLNRAQDVLDRQFPERNLKPDSHTYTALIEMYTRVGRLDRAMQIAREAREKQGDMILNCATYGCLVDGLARAHRFDECWEMLRIMRRLSYKPYEKHMRLLRIRCVQRRVRPPDGLVTRDPNAWRKPQVIQKALKSVRDSKKRKKLTNMQIHAMQRI